MDRDLLLEWKRFLVFRCSQVNVGFLGAPNPIFEVKVMSSKRKDSNPSKTPSALVTTRMSNKVKEVKVTTRPTVRHDLEWVPCHGTLKFRSSFTFRFAGLQ